MSTFSLLLLQPFFIFHTIRNEFIESPFLLLVVITDLKFTELCRK